MTVPTALSVRRGPSLAAAAIVAAGAVLLVIRPFLAADGHPIATLIALFGVLLVVGCSWPVDGGSGEVPLLPAAVGLALGLVAFGAGRILGGGHPPAPFAGRVIALNTLAAVAEEAFFRRFVFGVLAAGGTAIALSGSAVLFAVVHVTVYGWWVLPIDVAAGLVLGWQRLATGQWWVPAITHIVANILVVI